MTTLGETAKAYEPQHTKNIVDLNVVSLSFPMEDRSGKDKDNKEFNYNVLVVDGIDYRVPNSVIEAIQDIQREKPDLKEVKVTKKGEGFNTKYTVIPLA